MAPAKRCRTLPGYWIRREAVALQHESVEVTPGGSRWHVLACTTPGGTMRTASYASPSRASVEQQCDSNEDVDWEVHYAVTSLVTTVVTMVWSCNTVIMVVIIVIQ